MSRQTSVHDLERLVQSFHTLIAVETVEEERVRSILLEVATRLSVPLYEWSLNGGLRRRVGGELEGVRNPVLRASPREIHAFTGDVRHRPAAPSPQLGLTRRAAGR